MSNRKAVNIQQFKPKQRTPFVDTPVAREETVGLSKLIHLPIHPSIHPSIRRSAYKKEERALTNTPADADSTSNPCNPAQPSESRMHSKMWIHPNIQRFVCLFAQPLVLFNHRVTHMQKKYHRHPHACMHACM